MTKVKRCIKVFNLMFNSIFLWIQFSHSPEAIRMTSCWRAFVICWLTSSIFAKAVNTCSVQPTATVVVVGESVSLNCTATGDISIRSWQIGTDVKNKTVVYTAPSFGQNGTVRTVKHVADGYSVTNEAENRTSLHINHITFSQAGLYVCQCGDQLQSIATTAIVVLASEPKFAVIFSVTDGKLVNFSCSISFNGSADVSSNLKINDIAGSTANRTVCSQSNALTSCNLKYTSTANASVDQSYSCSVQLITNNTIIYSRIVNTSLPWQRGSSTKTPTENDNSPPILIVIGISVAIGVIAIIIAIVVVRICCFRKQNGPSTQDFRALSAEDSSSEAPQRPPKNRYDKTKVKNSAKQGFAPTATDHKASANNKASDGTEVVVIDNEFYEGARFASPNPAAPSAIPEENIYNEIHNLN